MPKKKKPTMKEMTQVVSNLINEVRVMQASLLNLDFVIDSYFEWKEETGDFKAYVKQRVEKVRKQTENRAGNSKNNNGQQKVSK